MSMITELIERLKNYAQILEDTSTNKGSADLMCIKTMREAADVIYELSSKLHAINMERSSQYYHGGWVPCEERLPEENGVYLISYEDAVTLMEFFNGKWFLYQRQPAEEAGTVLAWQPLPTEYKNIEGSDTE